MTDTFLQRFEERRAARQAADRTFTIAGVELTYRPSVAPEIGMRLEEMRQEVRVQLEALKAEAAKAEKQAQTNGGEVDMEALAAAVDNMKVTDTEMLQTGDETVLACLTVESREAWGALRSPDADQPLTFDEVFEIADYLLGRVAGIPTSAPADSSDGRTETSKPSKARSSSRATSPTT